MKRILAAKRVLYYISIALLILFVGCEKGCNKKKLPTEPEGKAVYGLR